MNLFLGSTYRCSCRGHRRTSLYLFLGIAKGKEGIELLASFAVSLLLQHIYHLNSLRHQYYLGYIHKIGFYFHRSKLGYLAAWACVSQDLK